MLEGVVVKEDHTRGIVELRQESFATTSLPSFMNLPNWD